MVKTKKTIQKNKILPLLISILVISFLVRAYHLGSENLWSDEGVTVYHSDKPVLDNIQWSLAIGYFPLYHIILSSWTKFFGVSEFSVRFPSLIFGVLAVYAVFQIATFMFNKKVGVYSSIIMALSPFSVYYSQEARVYTLLLLLSLYSIYFYLRYIKSAKNKHMAGYIISTLLMLSSHPPAIFILIFQNMHYFLLVRKKIKKWLLIQLSLSVALIPLIWITVPNLSRVSNYFIAPKPDLATLMRTFYIFSAGVTYEIESMVVGGVISILFAIFISITLFKMVKDVKKSSTSESNKTIFLFLWLCVPAILLVLQAYFYYSIYFEKYIMVSSAALYILIALCISRFKQGIQFVSIVTVIVFSLSILYMDFNAQNKESWEDAADYIRMNKHQEDAVVIHVHTSIYSFTYYFDPECFTSKDLPKGYINYDHYTKIDCMSAQNIYGVKNADELPKEVTEKEKVFLILWNAKYVDVEGTLLKYFSSNYDLVEEKHQRHMHIYAFKKPTKINSLNL